jgi:hypothetical protein
MWYAAAFCPRRPLFSVDGIRFRTDRMRMVCGVVPLLEAGANIMGGILMRTPMRRFGNPE